MEIPLERHGKTVFSLFDRKQSRYRFFKNADISNVFTQCSHLQTDVAAEISLVLDTTPNSWKTHNIGLVYRVVWV